jgi:hypothetical protein
MNLDVWFSEDVVRILLSIHGTMQNATRAVPASNPRLAASYQRGFEDALISVASAFGIRCIEPTRSPVGFLSNDSQPPAKAD